MNWLKPKIPVVSVALIVIASAFGGAYISYHRETEKLRLLIEEAPAKIENVGVQRAVSPVLGNEYTVAVAVKFSYEVNGRTYERQTELNQRNAVQFVPWSKGKVCYDPRNEETIEKPKLFPVAHRCGEP